MKDQLKTQLMRTLILVICFMTGFTLHAQNNYQHTFQDIAELEKSKYERRLNIGNDSPYYNASDNFDIKYYRAEWEVDPEAKLVKGKITSYFVMNKTGNEIAFDLSDNMKVSHITRRNISLSFVQENKTLKISLPNTLLAGSLDSLSVYYKGIPGRGMSFESAVGKPVFFTSSEPYGSRDWWPCKNGTGTKVDSIDIFIRHPTDLTAVSNGVLQSITTDTENKKVTHWKHHYPIATYLIAISVGKYITFDNYLPTRTGQFLMQTYCFSESEKSYRAGVQTIVEANATFSELIGDYPFAKEKYAHVQAPDGMENQTCSFVGGTSEFVLVHEYAHQWFGDKVTCRSWEDMWLNEGFATFMESVFQESKNPDLVTERRATSISNITSSPFGSVKCESNEPSVIFDSELRYHKGAHLLQMLRWILGDQVFWGGLRSYLNDPGLAYGLATTADLKRNLEETSGKDLTYFFDQWYTGQGYPSYHMEWTPIGTKVKLKLDQVTSHSSVNFFKLPVPVLFGNKANGKQKLITVNHQKSGEIFEEEIGFLADTVTIDPDLVLISKDNVIKKTGDPVLGENRTELEIKISPNPVQDLLTVQITIDNPLSLSATIYDLAGRATGNSSIRVTKGTRLYSIGILKDRQPGLYILHLMSANGRYAKSFSFLKF